MSQPRISRFIVAVLLLAAPVAAADVPEYESIAVQQRNGAYEMTVPVSRLVVSIPRGDLVLDKDATGGVKSPRYFYLKDDSQHLIISGWFDAEQGFSGIREFWEGETKQWLDNGHLQPQDVSFAKYSGWDAVLYDIPTPFGSNSHIRAHWLQAGMWIDLHLSITSGRPPAENRATLKSALKAIRVRLKE